MLFIYDDKMLPIRIILYCQRMGVAWDSNFYKSVSLERCIHNSMSFHSSFYYLLMMTVFGRKGFEHEMIKFKICIAYVKVKTGRWEEITALRRRGVKFNINHLSRGN